MHTRKAIRLTVLAAIWTLAGCSATTAVPDGSPILSAADARSMIRVQIRVIEPVEVPPPLVATTN